MFGEEEIGFVQEEFLPHIISAKTFFTEDTIYYFFVDVSSATKELPNHEGVKSIIPITAEFLKEYEKSTQEYFEDYSKKVIIDLLLLEYSNDLNQFQKNRHST